MIVPVVNAGSSSIKLDCLDTQTNHSFFAARAENLLTDDSKITAIINGEKHAILEGKNIDHSGAIESIITAMEMSGATKEMGEIAVVGHRFVNCGPHFVTPTIIDEGNIEEIKRCMHFAPLHNPAALTCVETFMRFFEGVPQIAVFDTAFHRTLSGAYRFYAIPKRFSEQIQKYGAHGTSYHYLINELSRLVGKTPENVVIAHLGNGSSVCAIQNGESKWTSMGQTPLAGCLGGTRSGSIDPAVVQFMVNNYEDVADVNDVVDILNKKSGLAAIAGISNMAAIVKGYENGDEACIMALDMYCISVAENISKAVIALGSQPSCLVFSAGIGENAPLVRQLVCEKLYCIIPGLQLADNANFKNEEIISSCMSKVEVRVIPTNEELQIAREASRLVHQQ